MSNFSERWYKEVKPLAEKCLTESKEDIALMELSNLTEEQERHVEELLKKYHDFYAQYQILYMINRVESCLMTGDELRARCAVLGLDRYTTMYNWCIRHFLTQEDRETEEFKRLDALRNQLRPLLNIE